ncbi:MAG: response regulator [Thermosynechococcaceae cyanobacterium]
MNPTAPAANILVIDDTPANLRLLQKILTEHGYQVRPVTDGAMALTAARLDPPDLILLDIKMPELDGYEVCRRLKADEKTREVPVIFLTVLDDAIDIVKGFALGGVDYITKPVKTGELIARIGSQVQLRSLQNQLSEQNKVQQYLLGQYQSTATALKESEEKFSQAFHNSPLPITIISIPEGQYLDANREFLQQTGFSQEEVLGHTVLDLNLWVDLDDRGVMMEQLQAHGFVRGLETSLRAKSGEIIDVILFVEVIQLDGSPYMLVTGEDITKRKVAEQKLADRTQELSQALDTLKETQEQLIQSAKMAALGNLVAGVAHEINTPVGTAIMMASTLENATSGISSHFRQGTLTESDFQGYLEVAAEASHLIFDNLNRAGELVQSFKQVAVDQSSLKDRTFRVKSYLKEVITNLSPQLNQTLHRVAVLGDDTLRLHSYPGALSQVITNLMVNSLTHAFQEDCPGYVSITVSQQQDQCRLEYSDDGTGICADPIEKIFEPFFTTTHHKGGSGLGLHLVYNLVTQRLQGTITVESTVNKGTTFIIILPKTVTVS